MHICCNFSYCSCSLRIWHYRINHWHHSSKHILSHLTLRRIIEGLMNTVQHIIATSGIWALRLVREKILSRYFYIGCRENVSRLLWGWLWKNLILCCWLLKVWYCNIDDLLFYCILILILVNILVVLVIFNYLLFLHINLYYNAFFNLFIIIIIIILEIARCIINSFCILCVSSAVGWWILGSLITILAWISSRRHLLIW